MILLVGATGRLGGAIAQALLAQGRSLRILLRRDSHSATLAPQGLATPAEALLAAGAEAAFGDLKDRASLDAACEGITTLITTANAARRSGADTFTTVDLEGTQALIGAAAAAEVEHFVYTSAVGSDPASTHPLFSAKGRCEEALRNSGLTYTILKPAMFMEVWLGAVIAAPLRLGRPVTLVGQGSTRVPFVSMADVAAYAVAAVDHPAARNAEIWIGGPHSASFTEAVRAVGDTLGRRLPVCYVRAGEPVPLLPAAMAQLLAAVESGPDQDIDMSRTAAAYGIPPTPLEAFAARFFGGR
ncbi:MAG TPA: NmrA family NAD(P)-binding protein [Anaerolineae bacterium]|nr:NmrA family NAD(P)-binding protein [Anaerolineae bacterium]